MSEFERSAIDKQGARIADAPVVRSGLQPSSVQAYPSPQGSARKQWIGVALSLVLIGGGAFLLHMRSTAAAKPTTPAIAAKPQPVVTVTTAPAVFASLVRTLEVTGSISAWDPLAIGAEANGLRIERVLVEEGDRVRRGQVLATLNDDILQAQLVQARARVASAEVTVNQRRSALSKSQATYREAQANLERYQSLGKQGAISSQEVLARETVAQGAKADLDTAQLNVTFAQSEKLENRAQIAQLQAQLDQTRIVAPDDGMIARRDARLGEIVSSGKVLFTIVRNNRLELRAQVPEVDLPKIGPGQAVQVTSDADRSLSVAGRVRQITPQVDERTRLGVVRIDVPSVNGLRPGMFVRGQVQLGRQSVLMVPSQAVLSREDSNQVYVLAGEQARARTVLTGGRNGNSIEIKSGLKPGERVIVAGAGYLKDGDYVRLPKTETGS